MSSLTKKLSSLTNNQTPATPPAGPGVYVIVPAFNEAARVGAVVRGLLAAGLPKVIVVDDGSTDATGIRAREAGAEVIRHLVNCGQGAALETGNLVARQRGAQVVAHFDGDGQFDPGDVRPAISHLITAHLDVVLGSRFLDQRSRVPFLKRLGLTTLARLFNWWWTGVYLSDAHNGFRVLGPRALQLIRITHDGMAHNSEIVAQIRAHGLRHAEWPVRVVYHRYGQRLSHGLRIMWDLLFRRFSRRAGGS